MEGILTIFKVRNLLAIRHPPFSLSFFVQTIFMHPASARNEIIAFSAHKWLSKVVLPGPCCFSFHSAALKPYMGNLKRKKKTPGMREATLGGGLFPASTIWKCLIIKKEETLLVSCAQQLVLGHYVNNTPWILS